jgi:hypothetical protein
MFGFHMHRLSANPRLGRLISARCYLLLSLFAFTLLLIPILAAFFFSKPSAFTILVKSGKQVVKSIVAKPGDVLILTYTHSMYNTSQKETYRISNSGNFVLEEMMFGSYAAAAYYDPYGVDQLREGPKSSWILPKGKESYSQIVFRIGYVSDPNLRLPDGNTLELTNLAGAGELIHIYRKSNRAVELVDSIFNRFCKSSKCDSGNDPSDAANKTDSCIASLGRLH